MRFLMQPRDLGDADTCDFLAGNPTALASPAYVAAVQRAGCLAMSSAMPDREDLRLAVMVGSISAGAVPDTAMQHAMPELERHIIDVAAVGAAARPDGRRDAQQGILGRVAGGGLLSLPT